MGITGWCPRAADYNVYWGAGGMMDSVIDVTHNVSVPVALIQGTGILTLGGTWGILNHCHRASGPTLRITVP